MKITIKNLEKEYPKVKKQMPSEITSTYDDMVNVLIPLYDADKGIKETVDLFIYNVNEYVNNEPQKKNSGTKSKKQVPGTSNKRTKSQEPRIKTSKTSKSQSKKTEPKQFTDHVKHRVEDLALEIKLLKRYANLDGKKVKLRQILLLHKAIEKAAVAKQIRKSSKYAELIKQVDNDLVKTYNDNINKSSVVFKIPTTLKKKITVLSEQNKEMFSVTYIKRFINLVGNNTKAKSESLNNLIDAALKNGKIKESDPYISQIHSVKNRLSQFIKSEKPINIKQAELNGLEGIAGVKVKPRVIKDNQIMGFDEIGGLSFTGAGYTGKWRKLIGDPSEPIRIMVWGTGGSGKSTLVLQFLYYLASQLNKKCLYLVGEETIEGTFREKVTRLGVAHPYLHAVRSLEGINLNEYDYIVNDSITSLRIKPTDLHKIYKKYPKLSVINIHHSLKSGDAFKGDSEYHHDIDTEIKVWADQKTGKHYAQCIKNRWGGIDMISFL